MSTVNGNNKVSHPVAGSKKKIIAIAATGAVLIAMALGLVSFKGSTQVSFSTSVTSESGVTTTSTSSAETSLSTDAGLSAKTTSSTQTADVAHPAGNN